MLLMLMWSASTSPPAGMRSTTTSGAIPSAEVLPMDIDRPCTDSFTDMLEYRLHGRWIYAEQPLVGGGAAGSFDNGTLVPASQVVTHNDEHWLYYKVRYTSWLNPDLLGCLTAGT